jgi:Sulfotransferase domain
VEERAVVAEPGRNIQERRGPAWLGIGAQRSGTTWFTDLLLQHPEVGLSTRNTKELHRLYRTLNRPLNARKYLRLFDVPGYPGEFTPFYLRALWVPEIARQVVGDRTPLIVLLRDPIDRFESAMRMTLLPGEPRRRPRRKGARVGRRRRRRPNRLMRWHATDAQWAGMYATQLECWASFFPREQFVVIQYEALKRDPQAAVDLIWERLGLGSVKLERHGSASRTRTQGLVEWEWPPGSKEALRRVYEPEVERLEAAWGIDRGLWPNF